MNTELSNQPEQQPLSTATPPPQPFAFKVIKPYSANPGGSHVPFLVEGLFKQGGLSSLVAKPKQGKSSLSRYAAVCVSKGLPFLDRETVQGEVLLISIEDPADHINTCLKVLEFDVQTDAPIYIVDRVAHTTSENIAALRLLLTDLPGIRLVVIDTLVKFVRVRDMNKYDDWLPAFNELRQLLRDFPLVSILCLVHLKKVAGEDPFDSMLGSSALRGEFDTNAAIYTEGNDKYFMTESRMGRMVPPTVLIGERVLAEGCDVVRSFSLGTSLSQLDLEKQNSSEKKRKQSIEGRIIAYLSNCENESSVYGILIDNVEGKTETLGETVKELIARNVITTTGTKGSATDLYTLKLNRDALPMHDFMNRFGSGAMAIQ